ncbi:hypothetical protein Pen01_36170 [Phytomonospora endophytica]|nr:hypothetical protein Pen01_36170 [Phytomonospora endophytica]
MVIFCEGEASEPDYINELKRLPEIRRSTSIKIEIAPENGVPLTLVKEAIERKSDKEVDECWCVFDVEWPDNHPNLDKAIRLAECNDINLAISNPCFEIWLILHFADQTAFMDNATARRRSCGLDGRTGKRIDATKYIPLRHEAFRRAKDLTKRHRSAGTSFPDDNPSSGMGKLIAALERGALGKGG